MAYQLPVLDPLATFVDVGSERMHVSIGGDTPKVFGTVTSQLNALRDWLLEQGVHSVAMEATGVYRMPLYNVLEKAKLEVRMINGRQTRNLPGRKTDMADSQWGATLHMPGCCAQGSYQMLITVNCKTTCALGPTMWQRQAAAYN